MGNRVFVADFETTVTGENEKQKDTEVWAAALVELGSEEVRIDNCIDNFFANLNFINQNITVYFHNLKFDGSFLVAFLLKKGYTVAYDEKYTSWRETKFMSKRSFKTVISAMGQWYTITVKTNSGKFITFKDSLKLLPFSVEQIGKAFHTKHKKLTMEYEGNMHPGGHITKEQQEYIENDVLVVKEALEIMFSDGLDDLTIGACCKKLYRKSIMSTDYKTWFPNVARMKLDDTIYGATTVDAYIRKSYKGGWCYLKRGKENQVFTNGITADVNSLYPSVMIDKDYPVGNPVFWSGDYIPDEALKEGRAYFIRIRTRFYLKPGYLPTVQIKSDPHYRSTEWLETSDIYYKGKYYSEYKDHNGITRPATVTLTLTMMDFERLKKHYYLSDTVILDGCWFYTLPGRLLFGDYINTWAEVKKTSTGAKRTEAKLFLNNLYGKFSARIDNSTKVPYIKEDGTVGFQIAPNEDLDRAFYIPVGSFVTSHARNFTIEAAQLNYEHFIYADTDSIHCDCPASDLVGVPVHATDFSHWALEASWDKAIFVRQKTYIEHVTHENLEPLDKPFYNIKCAGMDKRPKKLLEASLTGEPIEAKNDLEKAFLSKRRSLTDFKVGLTVPGKLMTKRLPSGILLVNSCFQLH